MTVVLRGPEERREWLACLKAAAASAICYDGDVPAHESLAALADKLYDELLKRRESPP